jgi:hypothetical protein
VDGRKGVHPKLFHKRCNWVCRWLRLDASQAGVSGVASAKGGSLSLVGVLVASESLGGVELARAVEAWEQARRGCGLSLCRLSGGGF